MARYRSTIFSNFPAAKYITTRYCSALNRLGGKEDVLKVVNACAAFRCLPFDLVALLCFHLNNLLKHFDRLRRIFVSQVITLCIQAQW
jgi:hypothetical protein